MKKFKLGDRVGRLVVIADSERSAKGDVILTCQCDCGELKKIRSSNLGRMDSCGCMTLTKHGFVEGTLLRSIKEDKPLAKNNRSGHTGVSRVGKSKWTARIKFKQQNYHLGTFDNYEDACTAREQAEQEIWGPTRERYKKGDKHE